MTVAAGSLEALWRGDIYRALSLGFDYPSQASFERLQSLLRDLAAAGREPRSMAAVSGLPELAAEWSAESAAGCQARYHALFDTQGSVGYCESAWRRVDRGAVLRDVSGFYRAFGFAATAGEGQADSIRHELAFMACLAYKEWFARESGWVEPAEVTCAAEISFLRDHLCVWVEPFAGRLATAAGDTVYGRLATLLGAWMGEERARLGLGAAPAEPRGPDGCGGPHEPGLAHDPLGAGCGAPGPGPIS